MKLQYGKLIIVHKGATECPEGSLARVLSHDSINGTYMVTAKIDSRPSPTNPIIVENKEEGKVITKEQMDTAFHVKMSELTAIKFERPLSPSIYTLFGVTTGYIIANLIIRL